MGNIFQCCHALLSFFKCQDTPVHSGAEQSPLLSSEESELDSSSSLYDLEDSATNPPAGITNPALELEHFLFPDIVLSSNPGGEVTLVEPMVCLLVSEEDEEPRLGEEGEVRSRREGRSRTFSEVETQTEPETPINAGVQTQTDSEAEIQTRADVLDEMEICWEEKTMLVDLLLGAQTSRDNPSQLNAALLRGEPQSVNTGGSAESELTGREGENSEPWEFEDITTSTEAIPQIKQHVKLEEDLTSGAERQQSEGNAPGVVRTEQLRAPAPPSENGGDKNFERTEHKTGSMDQNICAEEDRNSTGNCLSSAGLHEDLLVEDEGPDYGSGQTSGPLAHQVGNEKDSLITYTDELADQSTFTKGHMYGQKNMKPAKVEEEEQQAGENPVTEKEAAEEEEGAEREEKILFLANRPFLGATLTKGLTEDPQLPNEKTTGPSLGDAADLHEDCFTVMIQPPGTDSFELEVSGRMLVSELHQVLLEHELTCHRSCFSLQLGNTALDGLAELGSIEGIQDGALIRVVEDSYSVRDARVHLRHVRSLLRSLDPADAYNGVNGRSLSYLSLYARADQSIEGVPKRRASEKDAVDCSPPAYILPGCKERLLTPLQPVRDDWKPLQCLRVLTLSSWNPPPGNRKMHGDLMYVNVLTMEDRELSITCSTRGFYLNQSTAFSFNPKPAAPKILCHSLVVLLSQLSPTFKKNFTALQKRRVYQHPYELIPAPFQVYTWAAPHGDHSLDCVSAEETYTSLMGRDEQTTGQTRDWNEELQRSRELPRGSPQERLHRDRCIFKISSDFVAAAAQGAVSIMDGNVMPLNPGERSHLQIFVWNNLFFSQGFDMSEHYKPIGGDAAAHAAAMCDLRGVQAYTSLDIEGLHTLGTAVMDYRGIRVIAQTIVPGLLEKKHDQIVYGSNDNGKTVYTHPRFLELLDQSTSSLRIQRHQVLDHNNGPVELCSAVSTVGIFGNDGRPYILDLLRTFPPDLNFQLPEAAEMEEEVPKECQSFGYPQLHPHGLASLRPELLEAYVQHRYDELFVKMAPENLSQLCTAEKNEEMQKATECNRRNIISEACKNISPVSDSCFDIHFNPDVRFPGVRFPSEYLPELERQRRLLWDAAAFLLSNQIPAVLRDCLDRTAVPMDGATLTSAIHRRGVNVRYLGALLRELDKLEERERLCYIQRISISEVLIRSAKHIFRTYMKDVEPAAFSAAVSHFLNCLLSSSSFVPESCADEPPSRRRSRRRRSQSSRANMSTNRVWARLTSDELWSRIRTEAQDYYHYTFTSESIEGVIEKHNLQRISLLREMAIKTGIQVQLREYVFECRHKPAFSEEDVVNMFPVVKHLKPTSADATGLLQQAQLAVQQGLLGAGMDLISQALTLFSSVCGVLHEDVCLCLRLLGRLSYILGENDDAVSLQEKAALTSERIQGIDHPQTIQDYTHLALYCFAGGRLSPSLRLLYRARYLALLVIGDDHPQVALLDSMLGLVLHGLMENELSLKFLQEALTLTSKYYGAKSLKHAHSHHVLATVYESKGEFRLALQHEKEAHLIYKNQVGENSDSTKESSEYLKRLTQQAVNLQRAINHIASGKPSACVSPPRFPTPSHPVILQQLNLTCGITVIPLSGKELGDLRTELNERGKVQMEDLENRLLNQKGLRTPNNK
ncbi:clustered mitochondria protein homolog isoform X1 [Fundulus heteroclitus]|uniref:clustered mitochondria protein homolog isoform X1 n=1 Tax=Fundulus heteroclitus TaxID=8078 RepID=UPI00165BA34D|nr:clustered mitochondria protein homolog isoform X1 [Fundulus heteroclitus]